MNHNCRGVPLRSPIRNVVSPCHDIRHHCANMRCDVAKRATARVAPTMPETHIPAGFAPSPLGETPTHGRFMLSPLGETSTHGRFMLSPLGETFPHGRFMLSLLGETISHGEIAKNISFFNQKQWRSQ
ncbi:MAG: hypothetical protein LBB36_05170 [Fibromonadaceae bacterium]|nr:hypothetical protein [Fibromonadaceae bacterium]